MLDSPDIAPWVEQALTSVCGYQPDLAEFVFEVEDVDRVRGLLTDHPGFVISDAWCEFMREYDNDE